MVEASLISVLKEMLCQRNAVAWLPLPWIKYDLSNGKLVLAGSADLKLKLQICIVRFRSRSTPELQKIWTAI